MREVLLPKLGQTMEEATIEKWHKKEGDPVRRGDVLLEITTDKATLEVEAFFNGVLRKIIAEEGATLPVNAIIGLVGEPDEPLPENLDELVAAARAGARKPQGAPAAPGGGPRPPAAAAESAAQPSAPPRPTVLPSGKMVASPRARMRAEQLRVNLRLLRGTGPGGRIVERDVLAYAERARAVRMTPTAREIAFQRGVDVTALPPTEHRLRKADILSAPAAPETEPVEPLSAMRRVVAERMTLSQQQVPHFYLSVDVDMTAAVAWREEHNRASARKVGYNDLLLRACALALRDVPAMNASWADGGVRRHAGAHVGLAVALDDGLIVPVVRDADRKSLEQIAEESERLVERARTKRLTPDEYSGGVFTISNLGMFGVDRFAAIVNPGESGILAVGRIAKRPVVRDDALHIRSMMTVTLSADHRVVDGAIAARFLARVRERLESPEDLAS